MNIGEPRREWFIEPIPESVPVPESVPEPAPVELPEAEPEKIPT